MASKNKSDVSLRCYAYEGKNAGKDGYYAVCIDLSLVTWRPTFNTAKNSLNQAICGYIEERVKSSTFEEIQDFRKLILRPAPLFPYRFQYLLIKTFSKKDYPSNSPKIYNKPVDKNTFCGAAA